MRFFLTTILLALGLNANAGIVKIDDFSINQTPLADRKLDNITLSNEIPYFRKFSHNLYKSKKPVISQAEIIDGIIDINNSLDENSVIAVAWFLPENILPSNSFNTNIGLNILWSDYNPTKVKFFMNDTELTNDFIDSDMRNQIVNISLDKKLIEEINQGGLFKMELSSSYDAWDLSLNEVYIYYSEPIDVVEPSVLALILLGLGIFLKIRNKNKVCL